MGPRGDVSGKLHSESCTQHGLHIVITSSNTTNRIHSDVFQFIRPVAGHILISRLRMCQSLSRTSLRLVVLCSHFRWGSGTSFHEARLIRPGLQSWCPLLHCRLFGVILFQVWRVLLHLRCGGGCRKVATFACLCANLLDAWTFQVCVILLTRRSRKLGFPRCYAGLKRRETTIWSSTMYLFLWKLAAALK